MILGRGTGTFLTGIVTGTANGTAKGNENRRVGKNETVKGSMNERGILTGKERCGTENGERH